MSSHQGFTLLLITPDGVIRHSLPASGCVRVGRAEDNDIRIEDASVSRYHARIYVGTELRVEDLGGANGTQLGVHELAAGQQTQCLRPLVRACAPIAPGDRILFGSVLAFPAYAPTRAAELSTTVVREPSMVELYAQLRRAAASKIGVLLLGETGVGKEVFARTLHESSPHNASQFVAVNCAALPESLLEAELFGHEKGSFTGAVQAQAGLFESAGDGTLFLDEIGEMPLATQAKLLRVLEDRRVLRIGGRVPRPFDARVVCATNRDLETLAQHRKFRADLYFRIAALTLTIPPLRERPNEILPLAEQFLARAADELGRGPFRLSAEVATRLREYPWPGNVRELKNAMQRAAVLAEHLEIRGDLLPPALQRRNESGADRPPALSCTTTVGGSATDKSRLLGEIRSLERQQILTELERHAGNQTRAAEALGISRRTLVKRLKEYELPRPRAKC